MCDLDRDKIYIKIAEICSNLGAIREYLEGKEVFLHGNDAAIYALNYDIENLKEILKFVRESE